MSSIEWTDPPLAAGARPAPIASEQVLQALRDNPGKWAKVGVGSAASATAYRRKGFEATTRAIKDSKPRRYDLYLRWPEVTE